jgi:hypothetical protein
MIDSHGPSKSFKKAILEECKKLSQEGQIIEASYLFRTYFPEKNFYELEKIHIC